MVYINPIRVLNLDGLDVADISPAVIKKAKRLLFAEIELSDDQLFRYKNRSFNRSDIEKVIDEIDNRNKLEYYCFISAHNELENFLFEYNPNFFKSYHAEAVYKLPHFVDFISPYFTQSFNEVVYKAYTKNDFELFKKCNTIPLLVKPSDFSRAYASLTKYLKQTYEELDKVIDGLRAKTTPINGAELNALFIRYQSRLELEKV